MKKKILIMLCIFSLIAAAFAGCSQKDVEADAISSTESTTQTTTTTTATKPAESTTKPTETTTVKENSTATTKASENKTTVNTTKSSTTTTKSATVKTSAKQTTKKAIKTTAKQTTKSTTKKQTTTKKVTTTKKKTTTKKNVTAKEVQNQVNSYIRIRGIAVDSSLNSGNSGWSGRIACGQEDLNNGYSLKECKSFVNEYINEMGTNITMNCYYDGTWLYVCYL